MAAKSAESAGFVFGKERPTEARQLRPTLAELPVAELEKNVTRTRARYMRLRISLAHLRDAA